MYGFTLAALGRDYQCVVWLLRAFAEYVRVLRGQIISVRPPVRRWFVVETLYTLGQSYGVILDQNMDAGSAPDEDTAADVAADDEDKATAAVHYLTLAKNLIRAAPDHEVDVQQAHKVRITVVKNLYFKM